MDCRCRLGTPFSVHQALSSEQCILRYLVMWNAVKCSCRVQRDSVFGNKGKLKLYSVDLRAPYSSGGINVHIRVESRVVVKLDWCGEVGYGQTNWKLLEVSIFKQKGVERIAGKVICTEKENDSRGLVGIGFIRRRLRRAVLRPSQPGRLTCAERDLAGLCLVQNRSIGLGLKANNFRLIRILQFYHQKMTKSICAGPIDIYTY